MQIFVKLFVRDYARETISLDVEPSVTIQNLKRLLQQNRAYQSLYGSTYPLNHPSVSLGKRELLDDHSVSHYNIASGSLLSLRQHIEPLNSKKLAWSPVRRPEPDANSEAIGRNSVNNGTNPSRRLGPPARMEARKEQLAKSEAREALLAKSGRLLAKTAGLDQSHARKHVSF